MASKEDRQRWSCDHCRYVNNRADAEICLSCSNPRSSRPSSHPPTDHHQLANFFNPAYRHRSQSVSEDCRLLFKVPQQATEPSYPSVQVDYNSLDPVLLSRGHQEEPPLSKHQQEPPLSRGHQKPPLSKHHQKPPLSKHHQEPPLSRHQQDPASDTLLRDPASETFQKEQMLALYEHQTEYELFGHLRPLDLPPGPAPAPCPSAEDVSAAQTSGNSAGGARPKTARPSAATGVGSADLDVGPKSSADLDGGPKSSADLDGDPEDGNRLYVPERTMRLILLGKTGNGKSATGNSLLGTQFFDEGLSFSSNTIACSRGRARRFGVMLEVIDTPGFKDTHLDDEMVSREIMSCVRLVLPGPHAVLIAVRIGTFTDEEADTVRLVRGLFGEEIMQHVVVVFTHGDSLPTGVDIEAVLDRSRSQELEQLLEEIDRRYVVFNNKEADPVRMELQVRRLMKTVRDLLVTTSNQHFSNPFLLRCYNTLDQVVKMLDEKNSSGSLQIGVRESLWKISQAEEQLQEGMQRQKNQLEEQLWRVEDLTATLKETQELNQQLKAKLEEEQIKRNKFRCVVL